LEVVSRRKNQKVLRFPSKEMIEQEEEKVEDSRLLPKVNFFFMLNYPDQIKLALPPTQVRSQDERPPDLLSPEAYAHNKSDQIKVINRTSVIRMPPTSKERSNQNSRGDTASFSLSKL